MRLPLFASLSLAGARALAAYFQRASSCSLRILSGRSHDTISTIPKLALRCSSRTAMRGSFSLRHWPCRRPSRLHDLTSLSTVPRRFCATVARAVGLRGGAAASLVARDDLALAAMYLER